MFVQRIGRNNLIQKKLCLCLDHNQRQPFINSLPTSSLLQLLKSWVNLKSILKALILIYQSTIAYFLGGNCRYYPSCSHYALQAFEKHSFVRAFSLTFSRLLNCHPFSKKAYYDPVPPAAASFSQKEEVFK